MNEGIIALIVWWGPTYLYLLVWSIRIRWHVRKHKIKSLDTTHPITYKVGRLTDFQMLGEAIIYASAMFAGPLMFIIMPLKMITKPILPDE
jgi:hypothetical protein